MKDGIMLLAERIEGLEAQLREAQRENEELRDELKVTTIERDGNLRRAERAEDSLRSCENSLKEAVDSLRSLVQSAKPFNPTNNDCMTNIRYILTQDALGDAVEFLRKMESKP